MKSRMVQLIASMSLVLALASPLAAASTKPQAVDRSGGVISFFISVWDALAPSWAKSRGTMDPDGGPTIEPPLVTPQPGAPLADQPRSRGTMDPDGWVVV